MAVDEQRRDDAYRDLAAAIGDDATRTVFELLAQPVPDPVARDGVDEVRTELGGQLRDLKAQVAELGERMDQQFTRMETRFEHVDRRFEQVDVRLEQVDARLEQLDRRFERVEGRVGRVEERSVDLREHVDVRIDALRHELAATRSDLIATFESGLREAVVGQTRIIVFSLVTAFAAVSGVAIGVLG